MRKRTARRGARHHRRGRFAILTLRVCLYGCVGPAATLPGAQPAERFAFERYDVVTGAREPQTVLTGFLLGSSMADLAVVNSDKNDDRRLRILTFRAGEWVPEVETTLRPGTSFVDVAAIDGRDRLVVYGAGRLTWFDPESETERELAAVESDFRSPRRGEVVHVDITRDLNGDGRDELVVPQNHAFHVLVQGSGGTFADPVTVGPSTGPDRVYRGDGYRFRPWDDGGRVHEMDYDLDGRRDLVFWNQDHFAVHLQDERGLFGAEASTTFTTEVAFDSDDHASLAAPQEVRHRRIDDRLTGAPTGRVLHSLTDLNGDGVADLVVFSLDIRSMWNVRFTYEVHPGAPTPEGGTVFARDVGAAILSDGLPYEIGPYDFDNDGQVDVVYRTMRFGVLKTVRMIGAGMLTRSVPMRLDFYRMEGGVYSGKPSAVRKIRGRAPGVSGEKGIFHPSVLLGDVNGDSRLDLLVQKGRKGLNVFLGVPGSDVFAGRPEEVAIAMPNEEYTWLVDLNRDGKQDVLMHHTFTAKPHRVTMLVAR
ncbi:MAG: VCBS repeat-containing protein [Holophagales bacterium]|nr:VCBS repeat-containing protein [Holophagales bacterium]MYC09255.1 VCBS repeat-containing protein [Holophagales bacterium]